MTIDDVATLREILFTFLFAGLVWFMYDPAPNFWMCALGWILGRLLVTYAARFILRRTR